MKRGFRVWPVNVSMAKSELYGWLRQDRPSPDAPFPPGWCHFPQMTLEFFRQMTAEQYVFRIHKGFRKGEWVKTRERNEALDTRIYARAAAERIGISRMHEPDWRRLEEMVNGMRDSVRRGGTPPPADPASPGEESASVSPQPATPPAPQQVQQSTKPKQVGWGTSRPNWFSRS
jgi:phage terminase large subunit GpA-like protein